LFENSGYALYSHKNRRVSSFFYGKLLFIKKT